MPLVAWGPVITGSRAGWKGGMWCLQVVLSNDFVALVSAFSNTGEAAHLRHREESCA